MKIRYVIDIDVDYDYENLDELQFKLKDELEEYVKNSELGYYADKTSVKLQDDYCIKEEKKKLLKQVPKKPYARDLWELGTAEGHSCPTCGYDFPVSYFEPYCCKCGQAINYKQKDHPTEKGGVQE